MRRQTRRLRYGGKKGKKTGKKMNYKKQKRRGRKTSLGRRKLTKKNTNSWGLNKGTSKGCIRVCLGSTLR